MHSCEMAAKYLINAVHFKYRPLYCCTVLRSHFHLTTVWKLCLCTDMRSRRRWTDWHCGNIQAAITGFRWKRGRANFPICLPRYALTKSIFTPCNKNFLLSSWLESTTTQIFWQMRNRRLRRRALVFISLERRRKTIQKFQIAVDFSWNSFRAGAF